MKTGPDARKQELEQRILAVLADALKQSQISFAGYEAPWTSVSDLYTAVHASEFGHAGIFNSVLRELEKASLVKRPSENFVVLRGGERAESIKESLDQQVKALRNKVSEKQQAQ